MSVPEIIVFLLVRVVLELLARLRAKLFDDDRHGDSNDSEPVRLWAYFSLVCGVCCGVGKFLKVTDIE